ncbi:MAG TPA: hypothetical protein VGW36_02875 [Pyrinomonadaceae bacterium]|nr:hypothetical protein [Pyrinomonadaceae bacterium]
MRINKQLSTLTLLMWLAFACVSSVQAQSPTPSPATVAVQAKVIDDPTVHAGWRRYQFGERPHFSVIFPVAPQGTTEKPPDAGGATVNTYISSNQNAFYAASRIDGIALNIENAGDAKREEFFKVYMQGFARGFEQGMKSRNANFELKLLEPKRITIAGRPGFQQDFSVLPFNGSGRLVFVGTGAFVVVAIWSPDNPVADREAFFKSFQLTGTPK